MWPQHTPGGGQEAQESPLPSGPFCLWPCAPHQVHSVSSVAPSLALLCLCAWILIPGSTPPSTFRGLPAPGLPVVRVKMWAHGPHSGSPQEPKCYQVLAGNTLHTSFWEWLRGHGTRHTMSHLQS